MTEYYFFRHGESEGNVTPHIVGGRGNHLLLTEKGIAQARSLGKRLQAEGIAFDAVYASVAERAKTTAHEAM